MDRQRSAFILEDAVLEAGKVRDHQGQAPTFDVAGFLGSIEYLPGTCLKVRDEADIRNYAYGCVSAA